MPSISGSESPAGVQVGGIRNGEGPASLNLNTEAAGSDAGTPRAKPTPVENQAAAPAVPKPSLDEGKGGILNVVA
jgi:hypothetical protein